jgi:predicted heme/steroid binding protein
MKYEFCFFQIPEVNMKKIAIIVVVVLTMVYLYSSLFAEDKRPVPEKTFTVEELAQFDGKKGNKAYIAVEGVVYDVSNNSAWKNGKHKRGLKAGKDHSKMISKSPHGKGVLKKLPIAGKLKTK